MKNNKTSLQFEKEHRLFARFQVKYEIPNFLMKGLRSKVTVLRDRIPDGMRSAHLWQLIFYRKRMKRAYAENLVKRAREISDDSPAGLTQDIISLMVEIIRIIRGGLIDTLPDLRKAIIDAYDAMPLEHPKFDLHNIGHVYFPDLWDIGVGEEIFAKFVGNMTANFTLTETQKDRIQFVLKRERDKDIFDHYVFQKLPREGKHTIFDMATEYKHSNFTQAVLEVLKAKEDKVGDYDLKTLLTFLNQISLQTMYDMETGPPPSNLNSHIEFSKFHSMFCDFRGVPQTTYY